MNRDTVDADTISVQVEYNLGWAHQYPDLANESILRLHSERPGWIFKYDFSREHYLTVSATRPE